ncbi:MAG: anion permease, partial [Bacteroidota bacterium]
MEYYYILIVVILFALAISDLIVGVSNDAVNFLNSAIGSKAAPFKIIMAVAALGILVGATFSNGMMEVARKSIFHPDMFFFNEIMIIFLAVMFTDIILLDLYNTYGLPTSTTVSIVFELLGSAVAVALVQITRAAESLSALSQYINSDRALAIISGIFLSVFVAFTVGAIIQWFMRLMFSFNTSKTIKYWGSIWGGIAVSAISYFLLIKGARSSSFMSDEVVSWILNNNLNIIIFGFIGGALLFQLLITITKVNILKIIVLFGTFALAMAFASNDLVNFIGVPLAGLESFKAFSAASGADPDGFTMEMLTKPVQTPTMFLLIAGLIMALALRYSKKARSVTATEIGLSNQNESTERFQSSVFARILVRWSVDFSLFMRRIMPKKIQGWIDKRFDQSFMKNGERKKQEILAFDLVRASVNLVVASILISIGTSFKLPLSTTYVTFMVTMGTSLTDRAWGRESAVYRITGVLTVVGGWFLTALSAFTAAFMVAILLSFGGLVAIIGLAILVVFIVVKTHFIHKKREQESSSDHYFQEKEIITTENVIENCTTTITSIIVKVSKLYYLALIAFVKEKRKNLNNILKDIKELNKITKKLKNNVHITIKKLEGDEVDSGHHYVQVLDFLRETSNCLHYSVAPLFHHINNKHQPLDQKRQEDLLKFNEKMSEFFNYALTIVRKNSFEHISDLEHKRNLLIEEINSLRKKQIKALKKEGAGTKVSLVFLDLMTESKNMLLFVTHVVKAN